VTVAGRVALVSGGARGIGRGVALRLAGKGWAVAVAYRTSDVDAQATRAEIESRGGAGMAVRADLSDPAQCETLVQQVVAWKGRVDALVHAAGPYHRVNVLDETPQGWRSMFANNLDSLFYLARLLAPGMTERKWGRIVAFSMANAERLPALPQITGYALAKAGVLGLTRTLAKELAPHGITANVISPGFIDTGTDAVTEFAAQIQKIPAGRLGTIDDAVGAVEYLLSDDASYVNGTNIILSGGWGL
jgi:3-oxoacyl-[acyl-carrier protein] reductase